MKKISNITSYVIAVCLFCALYIFLFDLACIGKISKFNHMWANSCQFGIDDAYLACMTNYDIACIVLILPILSFMLFRLIRVYRRRMWSVPLFGFLLFCLSIIICWGLV